MKNNSHIDKVLWSIALPGFGQILNRKLVKGILFIALELLINVKANLNIAIVLSFRGNTIEAVNKTNFEWLMFYPGLYMYSIWDAYRDAGGSNNSYEFLPYVFPVFSGVIGVVYSPAFKINGILLGPVWLPIICLVLGAVIGTFMKYFITKYCLNKKV